ncbi:hypothetical protein [Halorarum salinum]|uniref:Uncharacterized protein n=1 Tax=Halorarum salinum TaxID=2743089 RepID=A0A7D5LAG1_9EURY|nr:hypothetical protein [Halobaculum salinum]QLG62033.1 hypothetical protein HUG12_09970 [Halobaculum salinum]
MADDIPDDLPDDLADSDYHPFYLGTNEEEGECVHHGPMEERNLVVKNGGHIHAVQDEAALYFCPECCVQLVYDRTGRDVGQGEAVQIMSGRLRESWDEIKSLFVDLGPGNIDGDTLLFDKQPPEEQIPQHIYDDGDWYIAGR